MKPGPDRVKKGPAKTDREPKTAACTHYWVAQKKLSKGEINCSFNGRRGEGGTKKVKAVVITQLYICRYCGKNQYFPVHLDHIYSDATEVTILSMDLSEGVLKNIP